MERERKGERKSDQHSHMRERWRRVSALAGGGQLEGGYGAGVRTRVQQLAEFEVRHRARLVLDRLPAYAHACHFS
eukprot:3900656-Rhodomonas_salina.1